MSLTAFSPDLALDIAPVAADIDLAHADGKLFIFPIPKSVLTCSVNTSVHFKDLNLNDDKNHINDVVMYCFFALLLSSDNQEFVKKTFSDFYVDVSYHPGFFHVHRRHAVRPDWPVRIRLCSPDGGVVQLRVHGSHQTKTC
jgi:hypothetical protein